MQNLPGPFDVAKDFIRKFLFILTSFSFAWCVASDIPAPLHEQKIKAGLVYNLIKYTAWPKASLIPQNHLKNNYNSPTLTICLFGGDPFDGYLSPLQGRTAQQTVISIIDVNTIAEAGQCNVIIIHHSQLVQLKALLEFLHGKSILTISDMENFAELGGMIELARQEEKIELTINKNSLDNSKLIIDSKMLKLAKIVTTGGAP